MIPAEAVEAAIEAFVRCAQGFVTPASDDVFKESVTAAVKAAAPYMCKPRQVTLTRELHALPNDSVIRTDKGFVFEKNGHWWSEPGTRDPSLAEDIDLPATVLHVGGVA